MHGTMSSKSSDNLSYLTFFKILTPIDYCAVIHCGFYKYYEFFLIFKKDYKKIENLWDPSQNPK